MPGAPVPTASSPPRSTRPTASSPTARSAAPPSPPPAPWPDPPTRLECGNGRPGDHIRTRGREERRTDMDGARPVRSPRGTTLTARQWSTEAPLRMLMNNLDPEVAERPDDLVVYGGTGRA